MNAEGANLRPDWGAPAGSTLQTVLRRIKGVHRRRWVEAAVARDGDLGEVPEGMLAHDLHPELKNFLQQQHPQLRGGEDLPDLEDGEVEVARTVGLDSVHGEVVSVRARPLPGGRYALRVVDEYETVISVTPCEVDAPFTALELLRWLQTADPPLLAAMYTMELQSEFYPGLDALAEGLGVKVRVDGEA